MYYINSDGKFAKTTNWLPPIYKAKHYKEVADHKNRFKSIRLINTDKDKMGRYIKQGGTGHYKWNTKQFQKMKYQHRHGYRHWLSNKYYMTPNKKGFRNYHKYTLKEFYKHHTGLISINDSLMFNYKKLNAKVKNTRKQRGDYKCKI